MLQFIYFIFLNIKDKVISFKTKELVQIAYLNAFRSFRLDY